MLSFVGWALIVFVIAGFAYRFGRIDRRNEHVMTEELVKLRAKFVVEAIMRDRLDKTINREAYDLVVRHMKGN